MASPQTIDLPTIKALTWTVRTPYTPSTIITYNLSLGSPGTSLPLVYEAHALFHALPTFGTLAVISAMGAVTRSMPSFLPHFQPHNHVHGEHYLELRRPFPIPEAGGEVVLETEARLRDVVGRRNGVGVVVGMETKVQGTGEVVCYNEWTSVVLKVPGEGASDQSSHSRSERLKGYAVPNRPPDKVTTHRTTVEQSALYRAASGDLNPLHIDPETAKHGGFPRPILTGTCTLGMGVRHVLDAFADGKVDRFGSVGVKLSRPVFPGEDVRTEMWDLGGDGGGGRGDKVVGYRMCVGERVVMRDGVVTLKGGMGRGKAAKL